MSSYFGSAVSNVGCGSAPPWISDTAWKHAWLCDIRKTTYLDPLFQYPNNPLTADQVGSFALSSFSNIINPNGFPGPHIFYLDGQVVGRPFFNDSVGVAAAGTAAPVTVVFAGRYPTAPSGTNTGFLIAFGKNTNSLPRLVLAVDGSGNMSLQRVTDANVTKTISVGTTADTNPHVWTIQYNGANSFLRQDMVTVASGDLGAGATTFNTFAFGVLRGNIFYSPILIDVVGGSVAYSAVSASSYERVERYLMRYMRIL